MTDTAAPRVHSTSPEAAYVTLREGAFGRTIDVSDLVMADLDPDGRVLGVEVLDGSAWQDAVVSLAMDGRLRVPPSPPVQAQPPVPGPPVIIEWPVPRAAAVNGWGVRLFDAVAGKQITTAVRVTVTAEPEDVIRAVATVFADADRNPVYDGHPTADEDGTGIATVDVEFTVTEMRVTAASPAASQAPQPAGTGEGFLKDVAEQWLSDGRLRLVHVPTGVSEVRATRAGAVFALGAELMKRGDISVNCARAAMGLKPFEGTFAGQPAAMAVPFFPGDPRETA